MMLGTECLLLILSRIAALKRASIERQLMIAACLLSALGFVQDLMIMNALDLLAQPVAHRVERTGSTLLELRNTARAR